MSHQLSQPRKRFFGSRHFWRQAISDNLPAGYDITAEKQFVVKTPDSAMRQLTSGVSRADVMSATGAESALTRDSRRDGITSSHQLTSPPLAEPYLFALFAAAERRGLKPKITKVVGQVVLDVICSSVDWASVQQEGGWRE